MTPHTRTFSHKHVASLLILITILSLPGGGVAAKTYDPALFVFGDSYADTGNHNKEDPSLNAPWRAPYGITWPGHPSGRFSDGRVFTDFYASYLNVTKLTPYRVIKTIIASGSKDSDILQGFGGGGINFAFGGSGVFPTFGPQYPTISEQIQELKDLIAIEVVQSDLIKSSIVLLVIAGNDYIAFLQSHAFIELITFVPKVVAEITASLQELHDLGFRKLVVTNLEPAGCLPISTYANKYTSCNETNNIWLSIPHNVLLASTISILKIKNLNAKFFILDFYNGFEAVIQGTKPTLRPCCEGINGANCGDVDSKGKPLYTVCPSPQNALFWDTYHPTNAGWTAISKGLLN